MKLLNTLAIAVIVLLLLIPASAFSMRSLTAKHSNQGYITDYLFSLSSQYSYPWATARIDFPIDYALSNFQLTLDCWVSNSGVPTEYRQVQCWIEPATSLASYFVVGSVYVQVDRVVGSKPFFILLRNIANPVNSDLTSYFTVALEVQDTQIECDKVFSRLLLTAANPPTSALTAIYSISPPVSVVGQGSTYIFKIPVSSFGSWYSNSQLISVRAIFPSQFSTYNPLCSIAYQITSFDLTFVPTDTSTFQSRSSRLQCGRISNFSQYITNNILTIKIETVVNPLSAKSWPGITFQIVRSIHNEIVQIVQLGSAVDVVMETFVGSVKQTNNFRNATNLYYLYLNHDVILAENSTLQITIGNGSTWKVHSVALLGGFTSPSTTKTTITNGLTSSIIVLTDYGNASRKTQQYLAINLTSPVTVGNHLISVLAQINSNNVGYWTGNLLINSTYGQFDLLSLSAVRKKIKLGANATGPLQLTFFLNYQLPQSQGLKNGSLKVAIYPQLTAPNPDVNGVLKCYFKGIYDASNCTLDNSDPTKSIFTIVSPPLQAYQYSEVPILITTEGAIDQNYTGFPINPLVTRYRFETSFFLYNSSTTPSEVYYGEWMADAVQMKTTTASSISHQCNQYTHVQVNLTMPDLSTITSSQELRLKVQFMSHPITKVNAWHPTLGYTADTIYKGYPCLTSGLPGNRIRCDLYAYSASSTLQPYNNLHLNLDKTGPFFIIYGFTNSGLTGAVVTLQFPKLKIGSIVNVPAMIKVSILEETPAMLQPYVQLFYQNYTIFNTLPSISIVETAVTTSQSIILPIQTNQQYNITWSPTNPSLVTYIKYEISSNYFPSFTTATPACIPGKCFSFGMPANWIVEKATLSVGASYSMQTLWAFITTIPFLATQAQAIPIHIATYDAAGNTVNKVFMNYNYAPQSLVGYFDFHEPVYYAGLEQWYSISFSNSPVTVSTYPFIRLQLDSNLIFSSPVQCNSTTIISFNSSGIMYKLESSTSLLVYNIKQIAASATYQMNCRMQTSANKYSASISPQIGIQLHHNYTVGDSFTAVVNNVTLQQAPVFPNKAKPYTFTIHNPQILNQQPQTNYVGSLFLDFTSNTTSLANTSSLKIILSNHRYNKAGWSTPTRSNSDPPVCFINSARRDCSWTNNPLTITIYSPSFKIGSNKIELTSQYVAPYNGVKFPGSAGEYAITFSLYDNNSTVLTSMSFFANIFPHSLLHFQASSFVKDVATESVYLVNFTIPTWATFPNAYNHASNYSRIFIEFPTKVNGQTLFSSNLGGYSGLLNERVGCSFVLGAPYISAIAGQQLKCILIPPQFDGGNVKIEIINHAGFTPTLNSVAVYIFKVFNPAVAYDSFDLKVSINQYEISTGFVYPVYSGKYSIFLDPHSKNSAPIKALSIDNQTTTAFFDTTLNVGNYGPISLTAQSLTGNYLQDPYYVIFKLPIFLPPENNQVANPFKLCNTLLFEFCITSPEINYVLIKARSSPSSLQVYIRNYPAYTSQTDSIFQASVIEQGRYVGDIVYNITASYRWKQILGSITLNSVVASGSALKLDVGRKYAEIIVQFTTLTNVPATGTIQIVFSSNVTKIYPNCRSATGVGSLLYSAAGSGALGFSGQIGCSVQNTNHWVITGFQALTAPSFIAIRGFIDLPSVPGTIGTGEIITYADNHDTDIYSNGSRIDYFKNDFGLIVTSTQAMNINPDIFMSQRSVLTAGYVGEFRFVFTLSSALSILDYIELSMYKNDIKRNSGGFALTTRPKVCEFVRVDTEERIGCFVDWQTETFIFMHEVVLYQLKTVEDLQASVTYELRLTTQSYILPEGIAFPTAPGTYKIDFLTNHTQIGVIEMEQRYIDVVGAPFRKLVITQFNFLAGYYSPFWVEFAPSTPILTTHQLVLEFPTLSNDGTTRLFLDDLGWGSINNGEGIPVDIFDCGQLNTFMNCRLFYGSYLYARPAKIICGNFQSTIAAGQTIKFAFSMTNPAALTTTTLSQISIPIFVYSYDPSLFQKINYNTVDSGAVVNNGNVTAVPTPYFSTTNNQMDMKNEVLYLSRYNSKTLTNFDYYVVQFKFPLRVNTFAPSLFCRDNLGSIIGTLYYHENLRTVICDLSVGLAVNSLPTFANLALSGFTTPWYTLSNDERIVTAIASYQNSLQSETIFYSDLFPLLPPRSLGFSSPLFQLSPVLAHNIACQQNDYIFTMRLQLNPSANYNLQYTKMILIAMPSTGLSDFQAVNTDCMQHSTSTIEIISCVVDPTTRTIQITIVPGYYQNGNTVAVVTRGLAIRNPCNSFTVSSWNAMQWNVYYLSFENGTAITPSINYAYMTINSGNMQSASLTINYQHTVSSFYTYNPFDWFEIPYQRYYNQFLQYDVNQYSPFQFQFQVSTAIPAVTYNKLSLPFGAKYVPCGSQHSIDDLSIFTPVCYLHNTRINRCFIDLTTNTTYMEFNFSLPVNTNIHAHFSVVDPRNPHLNGYSYIGTEDVTQLTITLQSSSNSYVYMTPHFQAFETQFGSVGLYPVKGITFGTIDYANKVQGQLNVLDMVLTVSRTDITALKFQIPMVDEQNNQIFGVSYKTSFFNLQNGDEYPCGNNQLGIAQTSSHKCYLYYGLYNVMGSPTTIIMTDFNQGTNINVRLMIKNPTTWNAWISVNVKAYTGTQDELSLYGGNFAGSWNFQSVFQTNGANPYGTSSSGYVCCWASYFTPSLSTWRDLTTWTVSSSYPVYPSWSSAGDYVIIELLTYQYVNGSPDDQVCTVNFNYFSNANTDDVITLKSKQGRYQRVYFIKKWTGASWSAQYFKCKHYNNNIRVWYNSGRTISSYVDYNNGNNYYGYYNLINSQYSLNSFYIFPLDTKTYFEIDLTSPITIALSQNFVWDNNVRYVLQVNTPGFCPTVNKCMVVEGLVSSYMNMPISCVSTTCGVLVISGFTQILRNPRLGKYRIKLQLQHLTYSYSNGYSYYSPTVNLYAHPSAIGSFYLDWYIFSASTSITNIFTAYNDPRNQFYYQSCHNPTAPNLYYNHFRPYAPTVDFTTNLINVGMNAAQTTIQLRIQLTPKHNINMNTGYDYAFPQFRFLINNFPFFCSTPSIFTVTLHRFGNSYPLSFAANPGGMITCSRLSEITISFYYWKKTAEWGQLFGGGVEGALWYTDSTLEFDIEMFISSSVQPIYYREWISVTSYVDLYQWTWPVAISFSMCRSGCLYETFVCGFFAYITQFITVAYSEDLWQPLPQLFNSVTLQPLTNNIGQATEMSITFNNALFAFGPTSYAKLLLVQLNQNINPFTYLNSSSTLMNKIQCKCVTDNSPGVTLDQTCYFRDVGLSSLYTAITIDIQLAYWMSATCYFPEWKITAGTLSVTAKLTNDYGGFPSYYSTYTTYGSYYQTISSPIFFSNTAALTTATITESSTPTIYSPTSQINTFQSDYTLTISLPQATSQAIVYLDFQKGGIIPTLQLCTTTYFLFCRIYTKLRHIMIAQFKLPTSAGGTLNFDSNFLFNTYLPTHWEYGVDSDYSVIARVIQNSGDNFYTFKGTFPRTAANLLPATINATVNPQRTTGNIIAGFTTNIILSFNIGNLSLYSYWTNNNAHIDITCSNAAILSTNRGCTIVSVTNPLFQFYCQILGGTLTIQNRYYNTAFTSTGLIQIIIGITNPATATPITFTIKGYQYYISATNYGLSFTGTASYVPTVYTGIMQPNQLKLYPFNTKVYSSNNAPIRMGFKLSTVISTMTYPSYYFVINGLNVVSSYTSFQCLFRQFSTSPTSNQQTIFPNSYRNYKQRTQHTDLYTFCYTVAAGLQVEVPRNQGLMSGVYYQLVIMPAGTSVSGFSNIADSFFKVIAHPLPSQRIDQLYLYTPASFTLTSIQVVTKRPLSPNALLIDFSINFNSPTTYPSHYLEIVFRDLDMTSIRSPYNTPGSQVPCTLSALFLPLTRTQSPLCIIQKLDIILGTIVMRVTQIGSIVIGNYQITFDDFLLPDLVNPPLEDSSPFTLCLRFHEFSLNTHYENCFDQLFVIDYSSNAVTPIQTTGSVILSDSIYGSVGVIGSMAITSYPMSSTNQLHEKFIMRINQGYAGTTAAPITLPGYTPLWYNPLINLYIYKQKTLTAGTAVTLSLTSLINPEAYDSTLYTTGTPSIQFTFFKAYHPVQHYTYSQPTFSSFTLQDAQIYAASVLYSDDIKVTIPFDSPLVYQMQLIFIDTPATIASKNIDKVLIVFTSNVTKIDRCWVDTKLAGQAFQSDGECAIVSSNSILLQGIDSSYTSNNLTLYIQLRVTGNKITYQTTVNCKNGQAQYKSTGYQLFNDVNSSRILYPSLDFAENVYTPYYYETVTQLTQTTQAKYLYFSLQLPKDLTAALSTLTITFPLATTYIPNNGTTQTRMVCQWLTTDRHNRKTLAGIRSVCIFTSPKSIIIQAPYAGLPRSSSSNTPITYLLKIREFFLTSTLFKTPTTTQNVEIIFTHTEAGVTLQDTLTVYPYNNFASGQLSVNTYTLTAGQLNTYDISFTPPSTISIGKEAILELSIDSRYMPAYLGLKNLYQQYGLDTTNSSWINNLGYNVAYSLLPNQWINGIPYSGYTSTNANAQQTCVYIDSKTYRVALLLESAYTAGVPYNWKIPLLLNPTAVNSTFRMNLTLYTYSNGLANPQKELFYEIINPYKTSSNISQSVNYTFSANALANTIQSSAASINIDFGFPFVPDSTNVAELKISSRGAALIGLATFYTRTYSDGSYLFYFFKRINLVIAKKMVNDSSVNINFGSLESTNTFVDYFGYDWVKIHSSPEQQTVYNAGSLFQSLISCSVVTVTPVLLQGLSSQHGSEFLQQFSFITPCSVPLNSTLLVAFNNTFLQWSREAPCYTSFRSSSCTYNQNGSLSINFNQNIAAGATLSFAIYLQTLQSYNDTNAINITGYIYALPDNPNTVIDSIPLLTSLSLADSSVLTSGTIENVVILPLYQNTYIPLIGSLKPHYMPLTFIEITHPFTWTANSHHRFMYRLNGSQLLNSTSSLSWIEANQTQTLTNFGHFVILPNSLLDYSLSSSLQYTFVMSSTYDSGKLNNLTIGPVGSFYNFIYESDTEYEYQEVYPVPVADLMTLIVSNRQVSQSTALGLKFKMLTQSLKVGDMIEIYLDSHNLAKGMHQFTTTLIQCAEGVTGTLSATSPLSCQVYQYPQNKQPMIIRVHPTKAVPINSQIEIWISPIVNPSATMVAGANVKVTVDCLGEQRCQIYEARGYFSTVSNMNIVDYGSGVATFTPSNLEVQMKAVSHTYAFNAQTVTAAMLEYPQNYDDVMTSACSYGPGKCIVFPKQKRVIAVPTVPAAISSLQLLSMNNGKYILPPSNHINLTILSSSAIEFYNVNHTTLTTIKTNYVKAIPTAMTITPTQTPNLFLRNYMNTAVITLSGLYTDQYVNAFYIRAPSDVVTWDTIYCNATLSTPTNNPYPTRLTCTFITATTLSVAIPQGVSYIFGVTDGYLITVNCKFSIKDFSAGQNTLYVSTPVTSGLFKAYGSYSIKGDDSHYYITQASQTIVISQNQIPPIGNIEFTQEDYMQRFANINDTVYFDLLFDPATTDPISSIQIRLPKEFGYPPVGSHDACKMIARTTFQVQSCIQIRKDNNTFVVVTPSPTYDNGPVIITIANQNHSNWFTAPSIAGSWYNYTVSAYAADGTLLQREYSENCSTIGGLELNVPNMTIRNGMDAMMEETVDVSFVIGSEALRQGYSNGLQQGDYYTNIKIQFENWGAFSNLLGTGYKDQQLIGCVTQGLANIREIQCLLVNGSDIQHQPYVLISGYERVSPYTNITISLPNILMLAANTRNVLWASVLLLKVGSWRHSYLYNPQSLVFKPSSNLALLSLNSLDLGYVGLNIVGSPSTFYVSINPSVDITTYFIIKFPTGFLNKHYTAYSTSISAGRLQIFYRSDLIRIYPNGGTHAQGATINYTLSNFPSSAFVMDAQNYPIIFQAYNNYKQVHRHTFNLVFQSYPCSVTFGLISATSLYSYDSKVSYTFEVQLPTLSADTSTVALIIPNDYPSLFSFGVSCSVAAPLACSVMTATMLIVRHVQLLNSSKFLINLLGIANPAGANHTFTLQTFNGDNLDQVMCQSTTLVTIRKASMQTCQSALSVSQVTINQQAKYEFNIICPQTFRNNSQVKIKISNDFLYSNRIGPLTCWADKPLNLKANNCQLVYQNATLYIWFKRIIIQLNQASLTLNVMLNNSIFAKTYSFTSTIDLYGSIYATTDSQSVQLLTNTVGKISSIAMYNVPGAGGSKSIYALKLPSKYITTSLQVDFPAYFSIASTVSVSAYFTNSTNWHQTLSYFQLLQLTYTSQVPSSVLSTNNGKSTVSITNITLTNITTWAFLLFKFIANPSYYDSTFNFTVRSLNSFKQLTYIYEGPFSIQINVPSSSIHMIGLSTGDSDLLMLTTFNITYRVDQPIYTNSTSFIITPPHPAHLDAIDTLQCCLVLNYSQVIECHSCTIGRRQIEFKVNTQGLLLLSDQIFTIQLTSIFTPDDVNPCLTYQDYLKSYYSLMVFRNGTTLTHESIAPSSDFFTPCQEYSPSRGDILFNPPSTLYAGLAYQVPLGITRPSKMVRIFMSSKNLDLKFSPNETYFNSYDIAYLPVYILVNPNSQAKSASIKVRHEESIVYNIFRDNLPIGVEVRTDTQQFVVVQQSQYFSVGNYITIPVIVTHIASYDMYLSFSIPIISSSLFQFQSTTILIPALAQKTSFRFRYTGDVVPQTLNVSLTLQSSYLLKHALKPATIYFFFSITQQFQTLPPVMKLNVMHNYINNSHFATRKAYNANTSTLHYDQLKPYILKHEDVEIGSTKASIRIFTRHEADVYYVLLQRGTNFTKPTPYSVRTHSNARVATTYRNSTQYVNAYTIINLTKLTHQTMYSLYAMAHDSLGDSETYIIHSFMTNPLPNAVQLRIDTSKALTDSVYIVHAISQILNIDILRVKDVDSYIIQNNIWTKNTSSKNQLFYRNLIVISPSLIEDTPTPLNLVKDSLLNNPTNRLKLKKIFPEFIDDFNQRISTGLGDQLPLIELIINLPKIKTNPNITHISYYNLTFTYELWSKGIVYTVAVEKQLSQKVNLFNVSRTKCIVGQTLANLTDNIPYSKQIIQGENSYNQNASVRQATKTDNQGKALVSLTNLKPGTSYQIYVSFTTFQAYQPILYASNANIMKLEVTTLDNPNIKNNDEALRLKELKSIDPEMYDLIMTHKALEKSKENLH